MPRPPKKSPRPLLTRDEWLPLVPFGLVLLWALIDVLRSYPHSFYPRYWDEGIYAIEAIAPKVLFGQYSKIIVQYAAAKLGYGIPLAGAVSLFGDNGAMYLSTLFWLATIILIGRTLYRHFGWITAAFATAFLAYVPFFGKYLAEVAPTTMAAFAFVLLWIVYEKRQFWRTGLVVGLIAMVDFKWALPVALAIILVEVTVERKRPWRKRVLHVFGIGAVALSLPALTILIHPAYWDFLSHYVFGHGKLEGFFPALVFPYYMLLFGAAPVALLAILALLWPGVRRRVQSWTLQRRRVVYYALIFSGAPILFYSLMGDLKPLRFFAVTFPLLVVPQAVVIGSLWQGLQERFAHKSARIKRTIAVAASAVLAAAIVIASDGPARAYRFSTGIREARERVGELENHDGGISSYVWPVTAFRVGGQGKHVSFTLWGLEPYDKWLLLNPAADRVTVELRVKLSESHDDADSIQVTQADAYRSCSDLLFKLPSDFYASDYFLCENTVGGLPTLRRWRSLREPEGNFLSVYQVDQEKLKKLRR